MRSTLRSTLSVLVLAVVLPLSACRDAITQPEAFVVAAETEAALILSAELPTLGWLVDRSLDPARGAEPAPDSMALARARSLWLEAQGTEDPGAASALRGAAYEIAAPELEAVLDSAGLAEVQDRLERWIGTARGVAGALQFPGIRTALEEGRALLAAARAAEGRGDRIEAVETTLRAADRLASTTPGAVALRLVREAEARIEDRRAAAGSNGQVGETLVLSRAQRLLRGAREALGRREYPLAIRRAYYAAQLLSQL